MRIIAGNFKGRKLHPIRGMTIRPTSDRLRETLFNILSSDVQNSIVLELFAGTGALGIEALSRGAASVVFIDKYKGALSAISRNIQSCGIEDKARIIKWDIAKNLKCIRSCKPRFNIVFMDPPYNKNLILPALKNLYKSGSLEPGALIVIEHSPLEQVPEDIPGFYLKDRREYGKTIVSFLNYDIDFLSKTEE